jgi:hypothetical protein
MVKGFSVSPRSLQPFHLIAFYIFIACGSGYSGDSTGFWHAISLPYQP